MCICVLLYRYRAKLEAHMAKRVCESVRTVESWMGRVLSGEVLSWSWCGTPERELKSIFASPGKGNEAKLSSSGLDMSSSAAGSSFASSSSSSTSSEFDRTKSSADLECNVCLRQLSSRSYNNIHKCKGPKVRAHAGTLSPKEMALRVNLANELSQLESLRVRERALYLS